LEQSKKVYKLQKHYIAYQLDGFFLTINILQINDGLVLPSMKNSLAQSLKVIKLVIKARYN